MPTRAQYFGWTVVAAGAATWLAAALSWRTTDLPAFLSCLALAALAATFKVKLPGLTGTITPAFVFVLVAAGQFGWSETVAVGSLSATVQSLWSTKPRPGALQLWFNIATLAISSGLTHCVAHRLVEIHAQRALLLAVAGLVLFVSNTLLVSSILALTKQTPLPLTWRSLQTWAVPYYLAGGVLAGVWAQTPLAAGVWVGVMSTLSVYLLSSCYRGLVEQEWRQRFPA